VERDLSRSPLFQVMFALQNTPAERLALPGLTFEGLPIGVRTAKFDLSLSLTERDGELAGVFEYATDLFTASTIERMTAHFVRLLAEIVANPLNRVCDYRLLSEDERRRVLVEWNETGAEPTAE